ncbi:SMI1/KNR4 family protein [Micromonospora sp. NPDC051006]|uniref:SMI1/KNR4 family protein n=1 Tax=Micromonospora sp. NPDC051006 TaxID=3364283 RepID=UPI0037B32694
MTDAGTHADEDVADAWARIEASLGRVLPASLGQLGAPAEAQAIDAVETALAVVLPPDVRASLRVHGGTKWGWPSPVPLDYLYDTDEIVEATRMWRTTFDPDPVFDDPRVWAYLVDRNMIQVSGPVRPTLNGADRVFVGTMNGDVHWFLDLDPPPGGTPGQVVRVDPEGTTWHVLAPSWRQLLVRYAEDLELFATAPDDSGLEIDQEAGPACEWGATADSPGIRPAWLRDVEPLNPYPWRD